MTITSYIIAALGFSYVTFLLDQWLLAKKKADAEPSSTGRRLSLVPPAPWAGQAVGTSALALARFYVGVVIVAVTIDILFVFPGGIASIPLTFDSVVVVLLGTYLTSVFLFVAIKGKAPSGWLPWR